MTGSNDIPNQDMFPEDKISRLERENKELKLTVEMQSRDLVSLQKIYVFSWDIIKEVALNGSVDICMEHAGFDYLAEIMKEYDNGDDLRKKYG